MSDSIQFSEVSEKLLSQLNRKWVERFKAAKDMSTRLAILQGYDIQNPKEEQIIQFFVSRLNPPRPSITAETIVRAELEEAEAKGEVLVDPRAELEWESRIEEARKKDKADELRALRAQFQSIKAELGDIVSEDDFFYGISERTPLEEAEVKTPPKKVETKEPPEQSEKEEAAGISAFSPTGLAEAEAPKEEITQNARLYPEGFTGDMNVRKLPYVGEAIEQKLNASSVFTVDQFLDLTYDQAIGICKSPLTPTQYRKYFQSSQTPKLI